MLRQDVPTTLGEMLAILRVPVSEEVGYTYLIMTERFGKSCCWNGLMIFWIVGTRL
jgi:hypothetical protein